MQHLRYLAFNLFLIILSTILLSPLPVWSQSGAMATKAGNKYRIITRRPCSLYLTADDNTSQKSPCGVFQYWYVLPPKKGSANPHSTDKPKDLEINGFHRVASGDSEAEFRGYIRAEDAKLWTHQQVVRLTKRQGRKVANFYPKSDEAVDALKTGDLSKATHREPEATGQDLILMPVLKTNEVTVNDEKMICFETAFMAAPTSTLEQEPANQATSKTKLPTLDGKALTKKRVRDETSVDIVFTVDTTRSMHPIIQQVKRSITEVTKKLANNSELMRRIRYGLVEYRDTVGVPNALGYTAKVLCDLEEGADHNKFLKYLGKLEEAKVSSVDYPEDVLAGVRLAMDTDKLKWNPVGWKQIVIVGDSSIKGPDHSDPSSKKNQDNISIAQIIAMAQPASGTIGESLTCNFVISVVYVKDPRSKSDHHIGEKQYNLLKAGRVYNGDLICARGGLSPEDFSTALTDHLLKGFKSLDSFIHGQNLPTEPKSTVSAARYPYPVLDLINALDEGTATDMYFASRFTTEFDVEGNRVLVPHLWVRKGDLLSFNALLEYLQGLLEDAGEPGSKDIQRILKGLQVMSTSLNLSEPITPDMPLDRFLKLLGSFPLKNPIFRLSIHDIAAMSRTDYEDWVKKIKTRMETLGKLTENSSIWFKLHPQAKNREEHAFIAMTDLP